MVFIDHMNFNTAYLNYYATAGLPYVRLDYNKLPQEAAQLVGNVELVKTYLFAPKPDEFLLQDEQQARYYSWVNGLRNQKNFDVIEGEYIARPVDNDREIDIADRSTYYKVEKGTDINIAVEVLTKAFNNAFDIAIFLSADTDYLPIYKVLRSMGKLVCVAVVHGQYIGKIIPNSDSHYYLDDRFFQRCLR